MRTTRRRFFGLVGAAGAAGVVGFPQVARAAKAHVVVIGGGFGGATCAKYLRLLHTDISVTLIERDAVYQTCPSSNSVIGGTLPMDALARNYNALRNAHGVKVLHDEAIRINAEARIVTTKSGAKLTYDKLVVAPGIEFKYDAIPGYSAAAAKKLPHAWKAGAQTLLLRNQLLAMKDGGTFIMTAPGLPYRCGPGPYERAGLVASYLKKHKPKSKILILDAKDTFPKQPLFQAGWDQLYPGMITWIGASEGGKVESVDAAAMLVTAGFGAEKGAVINVIPPQKAGQIALDSGLANDTGWCPVNPSTLASTQHEHMYVLGDSITAGALLKSASCSNSQAKVVAAAIFAELHEKPEPVATYTNTCYSLVDADYGLSVTSIFHVTAKGVEAVPDSGGLSPTDAPIETRQLEARYADEWYRAITADSFG